MCSHYILRDNCTCRTFCELVNLLSFIIFYVSKFFLFHIAKSYVYISYYIPFLLQIRITINTINNEQIIVIDVWSAIDQKTHVSVKTKWNDLNYVYKLILIYFPYSFSTAFKNRLIELCMGTGNFFFFFCYKTV